MSMAARQLMATLGHTPDIHHAFQHPPKVKLHFTTKGRTKQSFKDECDINIILARYETSGVLEHINKNGPRYLDTTGYDYQEAMRMVAEAHSLFEELPAKIRDRFENDPAQLLDFVHDPANLAESIKMGFVDPSKLPSSMQSASPAPAASQAPQAAKPAEPAPAEPPKPKA